MATICYKKAWDTNLLFGQNCLSAIVEFKLLLPIRFQDYTQP